MSNDTPSEGPLSIADFVEQVTESEAEEQPAPEDEASHEEQLETTEEESEEVEKVETEETPGEQAETQILDDEYSDVLVKVGEEQLSLGELTKGYQRQADYTRKSQENAEFKRELEERERVLEAREKEQQQQADSSIEEYPELTPEDIQATFEKFGAEEANVRIAKYNQLRASSLKQKEEAEQRTQAERQAFQQKTAETFLARFPDYRGNQTAFDQTQSERLDIAKEFGVSEQEFARNIDMRLLGLVEEIRVSRNRGAKAAEVAEKKVVKTPKVMKPGAKSDPQKERAKAEAAIKRKYRGNLTPREFAQMEQELAALS